MSLRTSSRFGTTMEGTSAGVLYVAAGIGASS